MDQETPQAPEIKTEVNKREDRRSGFFVSLLSKLGLGASATGGAGLGGAAVSGGLLATKAGVAALVLAGASVAGGLGFVGYKILGSDSASNRGNGIGGDDRGQFNSVFEVRPTEAAPSESGAKAAAAKNDGISSSLQYLTQANQNMTGDFAQEKKAQPEAAASAADAAAAADSAPGLTNNNAPAGGTSAKTLTGTKKFGQLSGSTGGGSSGDAAATASGSGAAMPHTLIASARLGGSSGMGAGVAGKSIARPGWRPRRSGNSMAFARSALAGNLGAVKSSALSGVIYDGGAVQSPLSGLDEAKSDGGVNPGDENKLKIKEPGQTPASDEREDIEKTKDEKGVDVTPWKKSIKTARLLLAASIGLMFLARAAINKAVTLIPTAEAVHSMSPGAGSTMLLQIRLLMWGALTALLAAAAAGAYVVALGTKINGHGQPMQGLILGLTGAAVVFAAGMVMTPVISTIVKLGFGASPIALTATAAAQTATAPISGGLGWAYLPAVLSIAGVVSSFLVKPEKKTPAECPKHSCHDNAYNYPTPAPSERVLDQYLTDIPRSSVDKKI